jgi:hypothetical protein
VPDGVEFMILLLFCSFQSRPDPIDKAAVGFS